MKFKVGEHEFDLPEHTKTCQFELPTPGDGEDEKPTGGSVTLEFWDSRALRERAGFGSGDND